MVIWATRDLSQPGPVWDWLAFGVFCGWLRAYAVMAHERLKYVSARIWRRRETQQDEEKTERVGERDKERKGERENKWWEQN